MRATLNFNLNDLDDAELYQVYEQAPRMYASIDDLFSQLRTILKYEEFPPGSYQVLMDELTEKERKKQDSHQKLLMRMAAEEFEDAINEWESLPKEEQDRRMKPTQQFVPWKIRTTDENGKNLISADSMVCVIQRLLIEILEANNVRTDLRE